MDRLSLVIVIFPVMGNLLLGVGIEISYAE